MLCWWYRRQWSYNDLSGEGINMTTKDDGILNVFFQGFAFLLQKRCVCLCLFLVCIFFTHLCWQLDLVKSFILPSYTTQKQLVWFVCWASKFIFNILRGVFVQKYKINWGFSGYFRHCTWREMCLSLSHFYPGSSCTVASPAKWWSTKCTLCSSTFSSPPFPPLP